METFEERIAKVEQEIRETPYHKGTQHHIGRLRARIARLKEEMSEARNKGRGGEGFAQKKYGDATVVLVGLPSVGKSTLLNKLTHAQSKVAAYDFTTLEVIPGMMDYKGAKIQIFDVPGIISGAAKGRGRGKEILSVAKAADLIVLITDTTTADQLPLIQKELHEAGLRLNQKSPDIKIYKKARGGINVISSSQDPETVGEVAREFRLPNAEIILKGNTSLEELIDALLGNRVYIPSLTVINKIDRATKINLSQIAKTLENGVFISAEKSLGLDDLKEKIWQKLKLIRIFLKPEGEKIDKEAPLILKQDSSISDAVKKVHADLVEFITSAQIWGKSAKFPAQIVSLNHRLQDGDVITFLRTK